MAARLQAIVGHFTGFTGTATAAAAIQSVLMSAIIAESPTRIDSGLPDGAATVKSKQTFVTNPLQRLCNVIEVSHDILDPAFHVAYRRALEGAQVIEGFAKDHPVFCLVIALGVLYIMAPTVIQLLGFTAKGPALITLLPHQLLKARANCNIEGSWAAAWESTYGGTVPAKSLFAYLQRLGMAVAA